MAAEGISAQHLDRLSADREQARVAALAAWRRAEAAIYPSVMVNAALYQQYIQVVRAIIDELGDVRTEDDLVVAWHERRGLGTEMVKRLSPSMGMMMDQAAVTDAAFCQRHREITREHGKEIALERLEAARRRGDEWVLLFDDVTPFGRTGSRCTYEAVVRSTPPRRPSRWGRPPTSSRSSSWTHAMARGCWTSRR